MWRRHDIQYLLLCVGHHHVKGYKTHDQCDVEGKHLHKQHSIYGSQLRGTRCPQPGTRKTIIIGTSIVISLLGSHNRCQSGRELVP